MTKYHLLWKAGDRKHTFPLDVDEVSLGRRSDSDVMLLDPYISRRHCVLAREGDGYVIQDLDSTHGSFVNGERIQKRQLEPGDRIQLGQGRIELHFLAGAPGQTSSIPTLDGIQEDSSGKSVLELTSIFQVGEKAQQSDLEKISHILDFQYHWEQTFSPERTFEQLLRSALDISGAERGFVMVRGKDEFEYVAGMDGGGRMLSQSEFQTSRSVVDEVAGTGEPLYMTEGIDQEFASRESIVAMHLRALACMPLKWISPRRDTPDVRGILYLDSTKSMHALSGLDQKILNKLADETANVFEKLEMLKSFEEQKRIEQELALAQETQRSLLPGQLPEFSGFSLSSYSYPTRYVGGDFYDFLVVEPDELTGVLADVSGKGVSAALLSSYIQGALQLEVKQGCDLSNALERTNRQLVTKTQSNRFVTMFLFRLHQDGTGEFISAGHNPVYLYRAKDESIEELASDDLILGAFDFATYQPHTLQMHPGDVLVIYTDGVTEATNSTGEMFEEERLRRTLLDAAPGGGAGVQEEIVRRVKEFTGGAEQNDDITCVVVQRLPES